MFDNGILGFQGGRIARPILAPDGSVTAPSYSFANDPDTGFYSVGSNIVRFAAGGVLAMQFSAANLALSAAASSLSFGGDVFLTRDAANTSAQRNGTAAQVHRIYNTFTDASNYERARFEWSANAFNIGVEVAGTGTIRDLILRGGTSNTLTLAAGGAIAFNGIVAFGSGASAGIAIGIAASTARFIGLAAGTTTKSQIFWTAGVAPTAPNDGDMWFDGAALFIRIAGVTRTFTVT